MVLGNQERRLVMNQEKIGKFISLSRKNKRLTQEQLAEKLGVSINAVSKWERGLNLPDVSLMEKLCEVLDFTLNELFAGEKLTNEEMVRKSEKNIMSLMMTLKQLRIVEVFTQILIGVGIALTISSFFILTKINQKVVFTIIGLFIWIFGLFFKVKIRKTINQLEN